MSPSEKQPRVAVGRQISHYQIVGLLGAGGMGEVYRARDTQLQRDVAIKVLPAGFASDHDRLRRFQQEARAAAALNHPNILAVHELGEFEGSPYIVTEVLEGETLREKLRGGPLPARKAIEFTVQVARGLAAAHARSIVHRDLKPENLFVTREGAVKILDFGLAKLVRPEAQQEDGIAPTMSYRETEPGTVMGTVGYMSPEQVRGLATDHRTDIFTLGAILYEMLSGKRAFRKETAADTANAILNQDPEEISEAARNLSPGVDHIIRHCLEKGPEERFQSASDLAFHLERLSGISGPSAAARAATASASPWRLATVAVAIATLLAAAFFVGRVSSRQGQGSTGVAAGGPRYQQLTFRRGRVSNARFTPDGETVVYAAAWEGDPVAVFLTVPGSPESRPLGLAGLDLLSISSSRELAVRSWTTETVARVPLAGGTPRELFGDVTEADWAPDGASLAVARWSMRLEFPAGRVLYFNQNRFVRNIRISPRGDRIAFFDQPRNNEPNHLAVVDLAGTVTRLAEVWAFQGLAWSPSGDEVWYTATKKPGETRRSIYAVSLSGKERLVLSDAGLLTLHDISRDGRLLVTHDNVRSGMVALTPEENRERDLSWLDKSFAKDLSSDGKTVLFDDTGEGSNQQSVYLRKLDGSPAVRLGKGSGVALSPDGKWALTSAEPSGLMLVPTGAGEPRKIDGGQIELDWGQWFPSGKRLLLSGRKGGDLRWYIKDFPDGPLQPFATDEHWAPAVISPDGRQVFFLGTRTSGEKYPKCAAFPVEGGAPRFGAACPTNLLRWSSDGRTMFIQQSFNPARVYRYDPRTGRRQLWKEIVPSDPAGLTSILVYPLSADGRTYIYNYQRTLSDLYLIEGVK